MHPYVHTYIHTYIHTYTHTHTHTHSNLPTGYLGFLFTPTTNKQTNILIQQSSQQHCYSPSGLSCEDGDLVVVGEYRLCLVGVVTPPTTPLYEEKSLSGETSLSRRSLSLFPFPLKGNLRCLLVKENSLSFSEGEVTGLRWFNPTISSEVRA